MLEYIIIKIFLNLKYKWIIEIINRIMIDVNILCASTCVKWEVTLIHMKNEKKFKKKKDFLSFSVYIVYKII